MIGRKERGRKSYVHRCLMQPLLRRARVLCALLIAMCTVTSVATAALQFNRRAQISAQAGGTVDVYGYNTGTLRSFDTSIDWNTGTYIDTQVTPDGNSVVMRRPGDAAPDAVNAWWDTTWRTRRCWTVTNSTAAAATSPTAALVFNTTTDIANGWMAAGGADIRATTGGTTPTTLPFNIVGPIPGASTTVRVQLTTLAAGASQTVCLYWGNPTATNASSTLITTIGAPLHRVVAGGASVTDPAGVMNWTAETAVSGTIRFPGPSQTTQTNPPPVVSSSVTSADLHSSVPSGTPLGLFANYTRVQQTGPADWFEWRFPVSVGTNVSVRLYNANLSATDQHRWDMTLNAGVFATADYRPDLICTGSVPALPSYCGVMTSGTTTSTTGTVTLRFTRGSGSGANRRAIWSAIEVLNNVAPLALTVSGAARREGLLPASGTWTSPVIDTGAVGSIYGILKPVLSAPNPAVGKPVTSSPVAATSALGAGNDGNRSTPAFVSTSVTNPFWEVDLGSPQPIDVVNAWTTAYATASNLYVFASNSSLSSFANPLAAVGGGVPNVYFAGPTASNNFVADFPTGTTARYIRLWSNAVGVMNLNEVEVFTGASSDVSIQVAGSNSPTGPWGFVGPDGTAASNYTSRSALPYAADGNRYYQLRATLTSPSGVASPALDALSTTHALTKLTRAADGYFEFGAPDLGVNWTVRVKTNLPAITASTNATLHAEDTSTWGSSQLSGHLDRVQVTCCSGNAPFFSTNGTTTDQTPSPLHNVGGFWNLSVVNDRTNDIVAAHEQVVDLQLTSTVHLIVPLRRVASSSSIPINVALGKTASQSSTDFGGIAARANDGNTNGDYFGGSSVNHTAFEARPWWQVDLGSVRQVNSVEVYNRIDCCATRLTNFYVIVSQNPIPNTWSPAVLTAPGVTSVEYTGGAFATPQTFTLPAATTGQYVRIWSTATNYLHVAEVRVIGPN
jgi:hypothetical protein